MKTTATTPILGLVLATLLVAVSPVASFGASLAEVEGLYRAGRYPEALSQVRQITQREPRNAAAWTWLGTLHVRLGQPREALPALRRAVALDPRSPAAFLFLGITYRLLGDAAAARAALTRAAQLDPSGPYGESAARWIRTLSARAVPSPAAEPAPPSSSSANCPQAPALNTGRAPAMSLTEGTVLQISDWEFTSDKDSLVVVVELENVTSNDVEGVRLDVRGFSLDGRAVATVQGTANRVVGEDYRSLRVRLPLTQPIFWIGFQVQDYRGRRPSDRLHSALASVPVELYAESALGRVKVAAAVLPPRPAASHLLCLHITDTGGLPLRAVDVSVTLKGPSQRGELEQVMEARLAPSKGTSMTVKWEAPTHPVVQVRIKAVDFAALPSAQ